MATYADAVSWIAHEDEAGNTPAGMDYEDALSEVRDIVTVALVADLWGQPSWRVAMVVLRQRGFKTPRGLAARLAAQ